MKKQELLDAQQLLEQAPTVASGGGGGGGGGGLNEELDGNALAEMQIQVSSHPLSHLRRPHTSDSRTS